MLGTNLVLLVTSCIVSRWEGPGNEGEWPVTRWKDNVLEVERAW